MKPAIREEPALTRAEAQVVGDRLGERVARIQPTRWGWATPGAVVQLGSGRRIVVQRRPVAEVDRLTRATAALAVAGVPVAPILMRVAAGSADLIAFDHVQGDVAATRLDGRHGDATAASMGQALVGLRSVPASSLSVDPAWSGPVALASAISGWIAADNWDQAMAAVAGAACRVVAQKPWHHVPSHGDFVPVNVVFDGPILSAIVDLDDVAIRHPLVDPAWWCLVVGHHHPSIFPGRRRVFLAAAGVTDPTRDLVAVAVLRSLQVAASTSPGRRAGAQALVASAASQWIETEESSHSRASSQHQPGG